jgi:Family of unknown function (DUF5754)
MSAPQPLNLPIKLLSIEPSDKPEKRFVATFRMPNGRKKTTHFGSKNGSTYIDHGDKILKELYWKRHMYDFETGDPTRAGYLSAWLLWGHFKNLNDNMKWYKEMFHIL